MYKAKNKSYVKVCHRFGNTKFPYTVYSVLVQAVGKLTIIWKRLNLHQSEQLKHNCMKYQLKTIVVEYCLRFRFNVNSSSLYGTWAIFDVHFANDIFKYIFIH